MAHDHIKALMEENTTAASAQVVVTLLGGVLLVSAATAKLIFDQSFYHGLLGFIAAALLGAPLVARALRDLWAGRDEMNELVALAVMAAFAKGEYLTAGSVAFFMVLSGLVETRTALGARQTIASLVRLTPTRAARLSDEGEAEVAASDLRPDDLVRVRPGDSIPGDGVITSGSSSINEATITGESLPVDRTLGDEVFGGTINLTGVLDIRITKAGADTTLGKVQELVLQAEATRTPAMRLIDRYVQWYTPVILMLAGIVLIFTRDLDRVIALLVIACPCAIILATPTAMVAALSAAARLGVLVKNVADLEQARHLTAIVFDKTGTLTTGVLSLTRLAPAAGADAAELLAAAAAAEQHSKHPAAQAVMQMARRARVNVQSVQGFCETAGQGVEARRGGEHVQVGRAGWLATQGVTAAASVVPPPDGMSVLHVAQAGRYLGWIGLEDQVRPDAASALRRLRELSIRHLVMVTGDRRSVADRLAAEVPLTEVHADLLPAQKLEVVGQLKASGQAVGVVGDGVNDAPALAAGDLSIAMGAAGSDVAIHSASVALMNNHLDRVPFLVSLSRSTARIIVQGLIFGVLYVLIFGTLSAMGLIHPILAAALHALSSIAVVFNSARLVRQGEDLDPEDNSAEPSAAAMSSHPAAAEANEPQGVALTWAGE